MRCTEVRDRFLIAGRANPELGRHLQECSACADFAARAEQVLDGLKTSAANTQPDAAFAARVVARLPQRSSAVAWAAWRALPATAALALVLSAWAWWSTSSPADLITASATDDVVSWTLHDSGVEE